MSTSSAVHFRGLETALHAFQNRKAKGWAVFNNRQFLASDFAASDDLAAASLESFLSMMDQPANVAVYTIKVYEELPKGETKRKSNTPDDGSFNFRFNSEGVAGMPTIGAAGNYEMMQFLKRMDDRLLKLEDTEPIESEPEQKSMLGQIREVLELPGVQAIVSGIFQKIAGGAAPSLAGAPTPAPVVDEALQNADVQENMQVLDAYATIKYCGMPDALQMLQKLALIAQTDQEKFNQVKGAFKMFL